MLLGACGSDDDTGGGGTTDDTSAGAAEYALFPFVGGTIFAAGTRNRLPFGIGDQVALLPLDRTPETVAVQLYDTTDAPIGRPIEVARHAEGLPRAYFPLHFTLDEPGIYTARVEIEGAVAETSLEVFPPEQVTLLGRGDPLPRVDTPTVTDPRGVTPICTAEPICPLHERSLTELVGTGRPTALLVATPAFCQVAICGPVLDRLLDVVEAYADRVSFVHAEVYRDPETTIEGVDAYAPIIDELGLTFEPVLYLVDGAGVIADRVDSVYDAVELAAALDDLVAA